MYEIKTPVIKNGLCVRDDMPGGNVCVVNIDEYKGMPRVHFTTSPKGGPEPMWFYFRIDVECMLFAMESPM